MTAVLGQSIVFLMLVLGSQAKDDHHAACNVTEVKGCMTKFEKLTTELSSESWASKWSLKSSCNKLTCAMKCISEAADHCHSITQQAKSKLRDMEKGFKELKKKCPDAICGSSTIVATLVLPVLAVYLILKEIF
eukprot:TRINITY_DN36647_c0_g1_i1.p1 TRINITY_DN36647_c0_g1~~TRINITY_DN36647_c0_g1_i1.p1  ORF type:complete len:147 (-),score=25.92 TRINITY_DN36647_c0_g1_i1:8-409(-)